VKETKTAYKILAENPQGTSPLHRQRHLQEDNTKSNFRKIGMKL
jgi:hypothetical protein